MDCDLTTEYCNLIRILKLWQPTPTTTYTTPHPKHCRKRYSEFPVLASSPSRHRGWWLPAEMPRNIHLFRQPWLSLRFNTERSGTGILRNPPRSARERCAWKRRIALVLTYHPSSYNAHIKHILLNNFDILTRDSLTTAIFPAPPAAAHRRDRSLGDVLVHISIRSQTEVPGTFACRHTRYRTWLSNVHVCGPKSSTTIRDWTFWWQIRERCVLHFVSSMPPALDRGPRS